MDIKDLTGVGLNFHASLNKPGSPSLQKSLNRLRVKNSAFRNLSKANVATIVSAIKPAEKAIRLKGGMSRYQAKSAVKKFWQAYRTTKGTAQEFSKQDVADAKEIVKAYQKTSAGKTASSKRAVPFRPYLRQSETTRPGVTSLANLNQSVESIKEVTDTRVASASRVGTHNFGSINSLANQQKTISPPSTSVPKPFSPLLGGRGLGMSPSSTTKGSLPKVRL